MRWREVADRPCSISRALSVVGERWTLLLLREAFGGAERFDEFQSRLGIARNVLAARLRGLVEDGVLERTAGPGRARYRLTEKGRDLYPVLVALLGWGDRWMAGGAGPPLVLVHQGCGHPVDGRLACADCGETLTPDTVRARIRPSTRHA